MKFSYERLVEDEMELLRKLNFIKNIKYHKEIINDDQREHDISVLFINDHIEVSFDMLLNYEQRNNIKFEIKSFKQISNPIELIQNFINNFEWKEGISYKDFFMK